MSRQRLVLLTLAFGLLAALGYYLAQHLEWEKASHRTGFSGEALHNPFHAGLLLMKRLGYPAERLEDANRLASLPVQSTLLLTEPGGLVDKQQRERLLTWVRTGGHLVLHLEADERENPLLKALGIEIVGNLRNRDKGFSIAVEGQQLKADLNWVDVFRFRGETVWSTDQKVWAYSDDAPETKGAASFVTEKPADADEKSAETVSTFARFAYGKGYVTAGQLNIFRSSRIEKFDHARLFVRLVSLPDGERPIFLMLHPDYPNLAVWLLRHAPEAIFALLLLLLASIWHFAPRFGPLVPEPEPVRPGLREHLSASGRFILNAKAYADLIEPLREETLLLLAHLQNRHPEIQSLPELGFVLSGIPSAEIEQALGATPKTNSEFLRYCQTLARLREHGKRMRQPASVPGNLP